MGHRSSGVHTMNQQLGELLRSPVDPHHPLTLDAGKETNGRIQESTLSCRICWSHYQIRSGIPRPLTKDDGAISQIKRREMRSRDTSYCHRKATTFTLRDGELSELDAFSKGVGYCRGLDTVDVGCGIGEMTRVLHQAARAVTLDFSFEALMNFDAAPLWGVRPFLPKTTRLMRLFGKRVVHWEKLWRNSSIALPYSKLLFAVCRRPSNNTNRR